MYIALWILIGAGNLSLLVCSNKNATVYYFFFSCFSHILVCFFLGLLVFNYPVGPFLPFFYFFSYFDYFLFSHLSSCFVSHRGQQLLKLPWKPMHVALSTFQEVTKWAPNTNWILSSSFYWDSFLCGVIEKLLSRYHTSSLLPNILIFCICLTD